MLTIWGRLNSHNVKKVAWLAAELDIHHVRRDCGGAFGYPEEILAMNPNRLVPVIEDDGFVLWESNAILRYLADKHGALWPADPQARALADRWMDWQFGYAAAQIDAFLQLVRTPAEQRDMARVERSAAACAKHMAVLEATLAEQPWLSGDAFGIGDIPMGVYAHSYFTLEIERPPLPAVRTWYQRLTERPGYASQVMIPLS
jgi:glutathione S-transferase